MQCCARAWASRAPAPAAPRPHGFRRPGSCEQHAAVPRSVFCGLHALKGFVSCSKQYGTLRVILTSAADTNSNFTFLGRFGNINWWLICAGLSGRGSDCMGFWPPAVK